MVKKSCWIALLYMQSLTGLVLTVPASPGTVLDWSDYDHLNSFDSLVITLPSASDDVELRAVGLMEITSGITCNGRLKLAASDRMVLSGTVAAAELALQAPMIKMEQSAICDTSSDTGGGNIYIGGGFNGEDPNITNANMVEVFFGAQILASAQVDGSGGDVVIWSEKGTAFQGDIVALGKGLTGSGGNVEISSRYFLYYDGFVDVSAESGSDGTVTIDPVSITIQAANPDIYGNGTNFDITSTTELDDATTTPVGFPNANSIITAGALNSLLTNNVSMILAAQTTITVNAAIAPAGTNVTLTLEAPTINLNSPITLASGGTLVGVGVSTINVGASGKPQNAADLAVNGTVIHLSAATYSAPLNILSKNITVMGAGVGSTTLLGPPGGVPLHSARNPLIFIQGGTNVVISDLTVDANYVGFPTNPSVVGIFFLNAGGTVQNSHVTKTANSPPPYGGGQQGNSIRAIINSGGPFTVNIDNNLLDFFQKVGIVANGSALTVNITDNQVVGYGSPVTPAAIGIQVSGGATGSITGNTISGIQYTDHAQADGILAFSAGDGLIISDNTITGNDEGILSFDTGDNLLISDNTISNSGDSGIAIVDHGSAQILSNNLVNNGGLAAPSNANTGIYIFSSTAQPFLVSENSIQPGVGATGIFTQGNGLNLAPDVDLFENLFIDP